MGRTSSACTAVQLRLVKRLLLPTGSVGPTPTATLCGVAAVPSLARLAARRRSIGESCRHVDAGEQNLAVGIKRNRAFDLPQRACTYVLRPSGCRYPSPGEQSVRGWCCSAGGDRPVGAMHASLLTAWLLAGDDRRRHPDRSIRGRPGSRPGRGRRRRRGWGAGGVRVAGPWTHGGPRAHEPLTRQATPTAWGSVGSRTETTTRDAMAPTVPDVSPITRSPRPASGDHTQN